jgi:hypothetical protein
MRVSSRGTTQFDRGEFSPRTLMALLPDGTPASVRRCCPRDWRSRQRADSASLSTHLLQVLNPIAVFARMYGTCAWEASVRQRKLRRVPYIWSGTALGERYPLHRLDGGVYLRFGDAACNGVVEGIEHDLAKRLD